MNEKTYSLLDIMLLTSIGYLKDGDIIYGIGSHQDILIQKHEQDVCIQMLKAETKEIMPLSFNNQKIYYLKE